MRIAGVVLAVSLLAAMPAAGAPDPEPLPNWGDFVYVEILPEVIEKAAPVYPQLAREAGVEGTVMVHLLVDKTGVVRDVRVVKSIPMLDVAAVECVRRWRFKPALSNDRPIAVWVAAPVRFALADDAPPGTAPPALVNLDPATASARDSVTFDLPTWTVAGDSTGALVHVTRFDGRYVRLECPGRWSGLGIETPEGYWGVFVTADGRRGTHRARRLPDGTLAVERAFTTGTERQRLETWVPRGPLPPGHPLAPPVRRPLDAPLPGERAPRPGGR